MATHAVIDYQISVYHTCRLVVKSYGNLFRNSVTPVNFFLFYQVRAVKVCLTFCLFVMNITLL